MMDQMSSPQLSEWMAFTNLEAKDAKKEEAKARGPMRRVPGRKR